MGAALEHLGVHGYPKTSGQRGLQVWVPIEPGPTFDETRAWVEALCDVIAENAARVAKDAALVRDHPDLAGTRMVHLDERLTGLDLRVSDHFFGGPGGTPDRNMVSNMKGLPITWDVKTKKNVKWVAELGSQSYGNPVVAGGMVFVGTNNENTKDPAVKGDKGVLMAFRESDGEVASPGCAVEDFVSTADPGFPHCCSPPSMMDAAGQHRIGTVVARGDIAEHSPDARRVGRH